MKSTGRARPRKYRCANCKGSVTSSGTGLGTWRCDKGCPRRHLSVQRRVDSGKEADRCPNMQGVGIQRPIAVEVVLL